MCTGGCIRLQRVQVIPNVSEVSGLPTTHCIWIITCRKVRMGNGSNQEDEKQEDGKSKQRAPTSCRDGVYCKIRTSKHDISYDVRQDAIPVAMEHGAWNNS